MGAGKRDNIKLSSHEFMKMWPFIKERFEASGNQYSEAHACKVFGASFVYYAIGNGYLQRVGQYASGDSTLSLTTKQ